MDDLKEWASSHPTKLGGTIRRALDEHNALKVRLADYEKQWTHMNYTICKYQEENAQLKARKP